MRLVLTAWLHGEDALGPTPSVQERHTCSQIALPQRSGEVFHRGRLNQLLGQRLDVLDGVSSFDGTGQALKFLINFLGREWIGIRSFGIDHGFFK